MYLAFHNMNKYNCNNQKLHFFPDMMSVAVHVMMSDLTAHTATAAIKSKPYPTWFCCRCSLGCSWFI